MRSLIVATILLISIGTGTTRAAALRAGPILFTATAYSIRGLTVKGNVTRPGTAAADPRVIPLGSKVRVTGAGSYSGMYSVTDTGRNVAGRHIDLYVRTAAAARAFGKKTVRVEIINPGDNIRNKPETTKPVPKSELAPAQKAASGTQ